MLGYLWLGFLLACIVVFFAILVTGRYPRPLFDYNVGALRWNWRVQFYGYGALGTDRYPPFSLAPVPGYRVAFDVPYPERLSRGLVLVTWLLAVPHYLVLSVFIGGGLWFGSHQATDSGWTGNWSAGGGPVTLLVLISAVCCCSPAATPRPLYDVVVGMHRWALRVAA